MQRIGERFTGSFIGINRQWNIGALEGEHDVMEVKVFKNLNMAAGTFDHGFCTVAIGVQKLLFQGSAVDSDPDRKMLFAAFFDDGTGMRLISDIAGIDADRIGAGIGCLESEKIVEMNIRNDRNMDLRLDLGNGFGILFIENRKADDLTAVAFQVQHLLNRFVDALGRDIGHGLQNDLVLVADLYVSDHDGPGFCSFHSTSILFLIIA